MKATLFSVVALLGSQASAHMAMTYPPPLRSKLNPFSSSQNIDYSITSPMSASGSDFPCKGTLNLLGTADAAPVATWQAGQTYNMTIDGGANHNGGSCQAALSFDSGKTFTVIHSYIGNCPVAGASSLQFALPADTPSAKDALFAWTWFNKVGNREFYMNCAVVTINGGGGQSNAASSFSSRPQIFKANINNGCSTLEGSDVMFPNPGPDVTSQAGQTAPPSGNCGVAASNPNPGTGGGNGGSPSPSANPVAPVPSSQVAAPASSAAPVYSAPPAPSAAPVPSAPIVPSAAPVSSVPTTRVPGGSAPVSSLPGGVFIPVPSSGSVSCDPETQQQTTMATVSKPAQTTAAASQAPAATTVVSVPLPTPSPVGGENAQGAMKPGLACTNEGQWLCVAGTHFQRCASGQWSVIMSMAAGTKCVSGSTEFVTWAKKRSHRRRHSGRHHSGRHI